MTRVHSGNAARQGGSAQSYLLFDPPSLLNGMVDSDGTLKSNVDSGYWCDDWLHGDENEYCENDEEQFG